MKERSRSIRLFQLLVTLGGIGAVLVLFARIWIAIWPFFDSTILILPGLLALPFIIYAAAVRIPVIVVVSGLIILASLTFILYQQFAHTFTIGRGMLTLFYVARAIAFAFLVAIVDITVRFGQRYISYKKASREESASSQPAGHPSVLDAHE